MSSNSSPNGSVVHQINKRPTVVKKKSHSMRGFGRDGKKDKRTRHQIKEELLGKKDSREDDNAPPNSDAKDDSMRIFEKQKADNPKEEYVSKEPKIGKRHSKKRRSETVRGRRRKVNDDGIKDNDPNNRKDNSLFKERASANNSQANSPDSSNKELRSAKEKTEEEVTQKTVESTKLAIEPEPNIEQVRRKKEAVFMKNFLTALKYSRPKPQPKSENDSDSSKREARK